MFWSGPDKTLVVGYPVVLISAMMAFKAVAEVA